MNNFSEILTSLGYRLSDSSQYYRTSAIYRGGDGPNSLSINKKTGKFFDFVENRGGNFEELISLTLNLKNISEAKDFLKNKYSFEFVKPEEKIKLSLPKTFSAELLKELKPQYDYWRGRGVSEETIKQFRGGVMTEGKLKDRFVFPIFAGRGEIVGFDGRDITGKSSIKWKKLGQKTEWKYPLFLNHNFIKLKQEVILVESIGNAASLFECGVFNVMVTFGTEISLAILNVLIKFNIKKIIISFDNDSNNNNVGNLAAEKARNKLIRYFDERQIKIQLPPNPWKDWNEVLLGNKSLIKF